MNTSITQYLGPFLTLFLIASANADLVDFENAASNGGDDATVTSDYFKSYGLAVSAVAGNDRSSATAAVLTFEATGWDGTDGFWSSNTGRDEAFSGNLGNYFIKAGSGDLAYNRATYFNMKIDYAQATQKASGEVWDIDGKEQYRVTALDANGNAISSLTSPEGSLNAEPWTWSFDVTGDNQEISTIEVEFVSTKSTLRGFAFDNFNSTEANYNATASQRAAPLPPALVMGLAGMSALFVSRKSRKRYQKKKQAIELEMTS